MRDKDSLGLIKTGALLVNTARGELVNMSTLIELIRSKKIKGVAVDVIEAEESWKDSFEHHPLAKLAIEGYNVILTPHIAGCTIDSMQKTELILSELVMSIK